MASVNQFTKSLQTIIDIVVQITPLAAPRPTFNIALVVGPCAGTTMDSQTERIRLYTQGTWSKDMLADGFSALSDEYKSAALYFNQSPAPLYLYIGKADPAGLKKLTVNAGGTGYHVGDILGVTQAGASAGTVRVATLAPGSPSGVVATVTVQNAGTGYTVATGKATTSSGSPKGTGCTVNITAVGESPLVALQACRTVNYDWYVGIVPAAVKADHIEIASWVEDVSPSTIYAYTTSDADCITNASTDVGSQLEALEYSRVFGQYCSSNALAVAAIMGYAMGQNSGLANSAYTLKFKGEVGITTEDVTDTQLAYLQDKNLNVYLSYGNYYNWIVEGKMANGSFFDEKINLDMLVSDIQLNVADLLNSTRRYRRPKPE